MNSKKVTKLPRFLRLAGVRSIPLLILLVYSQPTVTQDFYHDLVSETQVTDPHDPIDLESRSKQELRDLLKFIYFSRVAHLSGVSEEAILEEFPGAIIRTTAKTNARFFLHKNQPNKSIFMAIRGSHNLKNWLTNLEFWMRDNDWFEHKIHSGFLRVSQEIYHLIEAELDPSYNIVLTGHSMGGAIAAIIGAYLHNQGFKVEVITYAQPRVTDNSGASKMQIVDLKRVVIRGDIVNMLPPFNYAHFGKEIVLEVDRYFPEDYQPDFLDGKSPEIYVPLFRIEFGGKASPKRTGKKKPLEPGSRTFYNGYVEGGKIEAVHNLNAYFRAMRARISEILGGVTEPLNSKLESLQFPESTSFPILPSR